MLATKERSSFIGKSIPAEVKQLIKYLKKLSNNEIYLRLVKAATAMLSISRPSHEEFSSLTEDIESDWIEKLYPGILTILQRALRLPLNQLKKKDFLTDLNDFNFPEKHQAPLIEALFSETRTPMEECSSTSSPRFSTVDRFKWRIDVSISTTSLMRALEPSILCSLKTSENEDEIFEMTKEKFHELRYAVAEVLNRMQQFEKRSILKIET